METVAARAHPDNKDLMTQWEAAAETKRFKMRLVLLYRLTLLQAMEILNGSPCQLIKE